MAVMARDTWTDKRLDDLNARVESIDRRMETGFKEIRADMREEFRAVRGEFQAVRSEMATQTAMLNQTMYRLFGGMLVAWVVGIVAILLQT
jgi:Skp family chaperone for outer membrane proteins